MKKTIYLLLVVTLLFQSCKFNTTSVVEPGYLELKTSMSTLQELNNDVRTQSVDVSNFLVYIYQSNGVLLSGYPKEYRELAEQISLVAGDYQAKVYSLSPNEFPFPTFEESWVYYGSKDFSIASEQITKVDITASLLTSKVVFELSEDFLLGYPDYVFNIGGKTISSASMKPIYVESGKKLTVILSYTEEGKKVYRTFASTESIAAGTVTLRFKYEGGMLDTGNSNFNIIVDSTLGDQQIDWDIDDGEWSEEDPSSQGGSYHSPYSVEEAQANQNEQKHGLKVIL
ncbi:MAG: DUF4493 domain-containing protein [Mangrovibacterium sp.]